MVKLCYSVAEEAYNKKLDKIDASCFLAVLENYSGERFKDLVNEYKKQMPLIDKLLMAMAPTRSEMESKQVERYVYSTQELYEKIKGIQNNISVNMYTPDRENMGMADFHQIAHFLYKVGFITGRKRNMSGKIERVYYDEKPYLLEINVGDKGYSWEIHPAYRGALATGASDNWQNTLRIDEDN